MFLWVQSNSQFQSPAGILQIVCIYIRFQHLFTLIIHHMILCNHRQTQIVVWRLPGSNFRIGFLCSYLCHLMLPIHKQHSSTLHHWGTCYHTILLWPLPNSQFHSDTLVPQLAFRHVSNVISTYLRSCKSSNIMCSTPPMNIKLIQWCWLQRPSRIQVCLDHIYIYTICFRVTHRYCC